MANIDRRTIKRLKKIALPFFTGDMKWRAFLLLGLLVVFIITINKVNGHMTNVFGKLMTALSLRAREEFFSQVYMYLMAIAVIVPLAVFYRYTEERLGLLWRKWLSRSILKRYFSNRAYYKINISGLIDNPDQRIEEDIRSFTVQSLSFMLVIFNSVMQLYVFLPMLMEISGNLVLAVFAYASFGSIATYFLGRPLIELNFSQLKKEADYRYKLVNVRDNAESIAFLRNERKEYTRARQRLKVALNNLLSIVNWSRNLGFFTHGYNYLNTFLPIMIVAPLYMDGQIEFGDVTRAGMAFAVVLGALSFIVNQFGGISALAAVSNRLGSFSEILDAAEKEASAGVGINYQQGNYVAFKNVTIVTPNKDQTLVKDLNLELREGGLLITGPSGSGKSSILRAIAGLWTNGSGSIIRPPLDTAMFIPQRPYMVLGTLRNQLLYAVRESGISDDKLLEVLSMVGLEDTFNRVGSFDVVYDWPNILSTGEQQRLAFARLILAKPAFAILDESTTAIDIKGEEMLYKLVQDISPLYISVGYRDNLSKFHNKVLNLDQGSHWKIEEGSKA